HWHYAEKIVVRTPSGVHVGNGEGIANTMATLAEFPDRVLLGEDVIWSGSAESGFFSSHRIVSEATHTRDGIFGAATGKRLRFRTIADTHVIANQVSDEWLVRDKGAMVRQMGQTPEAYARTLVEAEGGIDQATQPLTPDSDMAGPYAGHGNDNEWGAKLGDILTRMMGAEFSAIETAYDRACHLEYPGGVTAHGRGAADSFWLGLRASLPSARFRIEHQIGRDDPLMPPRAAIRWSLTGQHDGWGTLGRPSGAQVHVMGITHAEFGLWGLRREYTLFDETAVWKQIVLGGG
ncbi:MAG: nuclear transport factor 2 family protein, partial [Chloroflexi bacterium]|nr:nuclear transport factor 2 family protein [Chloroflexota bacterium]